MNILDEINKWLELTIIELNLCPFAALPFKNNQLKVKLNQTSNQKEALDTFINELDILNDQSNTYETTLLVLPNATQNFLEYNDFIGFLEDSLFEVNLHDEFQVVGFHPNFVFNGLDLNDRANWVNRSPFPLIHILKTKSIKQVMSDPKDGEKISFNNERRLKNLSESEIKKYFWFF